MAPPRRASKGRAVPSVPVSRDESIEETIDRLAAEAEIRRVLARYSHAADRGDSELLKTVYHADGVDEHGSHFVGRGWDFAEWTRSNRGRFEVGMHHLTSTLIEIHGDSAAAESTMFGLVKAATGEVSWSSGRYLDRLERRDGEWRVAYRRFVNDVAFPVPAHRGEVDRSGAYPRGTQSLDDPAYALFAAVAAGRPWPEAPADV